MIERGNAVGSFFEFQNFEVLQLIECAHTSWIALAPF